VAAGRLHCVSHLQLMTAPGSVNWIPHLACTRPEMATKNPEKLTKVIA
jgi:hypothetical protein